MILVTATLAIMDNKSFQLKILMKLPVNTEGQFPIADSGHKGTALYPIVCRDALGREG